MMLQANSMDHDPVLSWLALKTVSGVGDVLYRRLIDRFGSPQAVFAAGEPELLLVEGMGLQTSRAIQAGGNVEAAARELERIGRQKVRICTFLEEDYPGLVRQIHDPPPYLYLKGEIYPEDEHAIAIVGSRRCTHYGRSVAFRMAHELALQGFTVVSGLAKGIDAAAHEGAIEAGGRTIGVLGCGIDVAYPREHSGLKEAIIRQGALVTERPMGDSPAPENFPRRNRIISGLSLGVLVVEATEKSGALITASSALEQGRDVFAVPGQIGSQTSTGTHNLIKQGAKLVDRMEDILEEIPVARVTCRPNPVSGDGPERGWRSPELTAREQKVYSLLSGDPTYVDDLTVQAAISPSEMANLLLQLELKGVARQLGGHRYVRQDHQE